MDIWDRLAFMGRRYSRRHSVQTGSTRLDLNEILLTYGRKGIYELSTLRNGKESEASRPDVERKLKISLLDAISELDPESGGWYEVYETAPSGDMAKVRIVAHTASGTPSGEVRLLVGSRTADHYFAEDPIFGAIEEHTAG